MNGSVHNRYQPNPKHKIGGMVIPLGTINRIKSRTHLPRTLFEEADSTVPIVRLRYTLGRMEPTKLIYGIERRPG